MGTIGNMMCPHTSICAWTHRISNTQLALTKRSFASATTTTVGSTDVRLSHEFYLRLII